MKKPAQWPILAAALLIALTIPASATTTEAPKNDAATPRVARFAIRQTTKAAIRRKLAVIEVIHHCGRVVHTLQPNQCHRTVGRVEAEISM